MSERYWLSGVQIGILRTMIGTVRIREALNELEHIEHEQFIGNMPEPHEDYKIVIQMTEKKVRKLEDEEEGA